MSPPALKKSKLLVLFCYAGGYEGALISIPPNKSIKSPPPDAGGFDDAYVFCYYCSPPKLKAKSPPAFCLFSSFYPPITPPKSKSFTLSPPIAPPALLEANFSKPAPKSKPGLSSVGCYYGLGCDAILSDASYSLY